MTKYIPSIIGAFILFVILGLSGCAVISKVDSEFHGGYFSNWELVTSAPDDSMIFSGVDGCSGVGGDYRVLIFLTDANKQIWQYDQCGGKAWQNTPAVPFFGSSYECQLGDDSTFAFAESRLPGEVLSCWRITWSWETVYVGSQYLYLKDGRIMVWTIDSPFRSLTRGASIGWFVGLLLTVLYLLWLKLVPAFRLWHNPTHNGTDGNE